MATIHSFKHIKRRHDREHPVRAHARIAMAAVAIAFITIVGFAAFPKTPSSAVAESNWKSRGASLGVAESAYFPGEYENQGTEVPQHIEAF